MTRAQSLRSNRLWRVSFLSKHDRIAWYNRGVKPTDKNRIFDYTRLAFWVGLVATMYVCVALINISARNTALREKADQLEENNVRLESEIELLQAQVTYFKTESFQEYLVREKLGLQAPGEHVVIVGRGDSELTMQNDDGASAVRLPESSHIDEWMTFLFGATSQ